VAAISVQLWWVIVLMGLTLGATSFAVQYGVSHLSANRAVVLFLFELVIAAVSSYMLVNEAMHLSEWLGAALIVSASLLSGRLHMEEPAA
jgi:drug/metabolite transporter (DMT)-like permease